MVARTTGAGRQVSGRPRLELDRRPRHAGPGGPRGGWPERDPGMVLAVEAWHPAHPRRSWTSRRSHDSPSPWITVGCGRQCLVVQLSTGPGALGRLVVSPVRVAGPAASGDSCRVDSPAG
ncbi:hypothetical protein QJS66_22785 [Kocuria rhizophila]|nr:hypothetical protein QJS66_22785 [Kocuria rhizophila]